MKLREPELGLFGRRVKSLREAKGFKTIPSAASAIGIPQTTYGKYESGYRFPRMEGLILLANFFEVCPLWLIGASDTPLTNKNLPVNLPRSRQSDASLNGMTAKVIADDGSLLELSFRLLQTK